MQLQHLTDPHDPRLDDYRDLTDRQLNAEGRRFVAESERVVRRLLASGVTVHSVLVTPTRLRSLEPALRTTPAPIFVAESSVIDTIAGFHVHRGCLAIGERPVARELPSQAKTVVILEDLVDTDNVGAIVRNAAAFGVDALLLSPRCADPFYRKAIRVGLGAVFSLPVIRSIDWSDDLDRLRASGFSLVAAVLHPDAQVLSDFAPPPRCALLFGAEGPGLSSDAIAKCDARITIPMSPGADSLNVATAAAVVLYQLRARAGSR